MLLPSEYPDLKQGSYIDYDVEANGLYPDDGHYITTVSVAWFCRDALDSCRCGDIHHHAAPFDQEPYGKPWYTGPLPLFGGDHNLPESEWHALHQWIIRQRPYLVAHNGQYDVIMAERGVRESLWGHPCGYDLLPWFRHDSMLTSRALRPTESAALKPTYERLFSGGKEAREAERRKDEWLRKNKRKYVAMGYPFTGKDDKGYDLVPWEIIGPYASMDAKMSLQIIEHDLAEFENSEFYGFYLQDMEIVRQAVRQERRGLPYDANTSLKQIPEIRKRMRRIAEQLPFDPTPDNAKYYFFTVGGDTPKGVQTLGLTAPRVTKAGAASLDALTVKEFANDNVPHAALWRDYSLLKRAGGTYYAGWADRAGADGRLRARIRTTGTVSTRFSIERINLQAMPQDGKMDADTGGVLDGIPTPRQLIHKAVAEQYPDWILVEGDMSQAELRLGSWEAGCQVMLDAYAEGADMHQLTADRIGVARKPGKVANLSLEYGSGAATFNEMLKGWDLYLPWAEVQEIHSGWNRTYPEFKKAYYKWERIAKRQGYVPFTNGVRRYFRAFEDFNSAWNQRIQGSLAQYMRRWILECEDICRRWGIYEQDSKAGVLMQVHDSMIMLLPRECEQAVRAECREAGLALWAEEFPGLPGDIDWAEFACGPLDN